jgi:hypothetical protein
MFRKLFAYSATFTESQHTESPSILVESLQQLLPSFLQESAQVVVASGSALTVGLLLQAATVNAAAKIKNNPFFIFLKINCYYAI